MRIFIADASPVTHGHLTVTLSQSKESIIVGRAYDAVEAANGVKRVKPDLVILNPRLASGGEIELVQAVKQTEPSPAVVVFMSDATPEIRGAFLEAGADFCLDEMTEYEKMEQITRGMVAKHRQAA